MPTIGVAIPCYRGHFHYVDALLANLAQSTVRPTQVVIACSGWDRTGTLRFVYADIPVDILFTTQILDTAANRNRAARALTTEFIAFLDVDDLMHPARLGYLLETFASGPYAAVYHAFHRLHRHAYPSEHPDPGPLTTGPPETSVHNGHVAVRASLMKRFQFDERLSAWRQEDTLFRRTLESSRVPIAYLTNPLTYYLYLGTP
jgi:hypothetical protein